MVADILNHRRVVSTALLAALCAGCNLDGPSTGEVRITVTTIGAAADRDPDGYTLRDEEGNTYPLPSNGFVRIPDVPKGTHVYTLEGLASNCTVAGGNSIALEVRGDLSLPTTITVSVTCASRTGTVVVTTVTTGSDLDPDGYLVNIGNLFGNPVAQNGTRSISGVREGQHAVSLVGLSTNCKVVGSNPMSVTVAFNATVQVSFAIECIPAGSVRVVTVTTGEAVDTNGYLIELRNTGLPQSSRTDQTSNGEITFSGLIPGNYLVSVFELAANCDPVVPSPHTVAVTQGAVSRLEIGIVCAAPGTIALVTESSSTDLNISTIRLDGTGFTVLTNDPRLDVDPAWSPDRSRIAFASDRDGNFEIYSMNANGTNLVRLTSNLAVDRNPDWSPDGSRIVFESDRPGNQEIYVMNADGSNQVRLTESPSADIHPAWSPDGTRIAFASDRAAPFSIFAMNPDGSNVTRLTVASFPEVRPAWSPDGARLAYTSALSPTQNVIYVMNADGSGRTLLTNEFDDLAGPAWSPSGGKIAFSVRYCAFYYYYTYCNRVLRFMTPSGIQYWSAITNRPIRDIAWR